MIIVRFFLRLFKRRKSVNQFQEKDDEILPMNIEHLQRNVKKEQFE